MRHETLINEARTLAPHSRLQLFKMEWMTGVKLPWYKGKQSKVKYSSSTGRLNTLVLANNVAVSYNRGRSDCLPCEKKMRSKDRKSGLIFVPLSRSRRCSKVSLAIAFFFWSRFEFSSVVKQWWIGQQVTRRYIILNKSFRFLLQEVLFLRVEWCGHGC